MTRRTLSSLSKKSPCISNSPFELVSSAFEIGGADLGIGEQFLAGAAHRHLAVHHHVGAMRQPECREGILLDQEHGEAFLLIELADRLENALDDQRREAKRRFVEQQELRTRHQGAADRQHLLFAARKRAAALGVTFLETRKERKDLLDVLGEVFEIVEAGAHLKVFQHRHAREDAASLRRLRDAQARNLVCRHLGDIAALEDDRALASLWAAADRHHQRRLAGAVGADQADDLALVDLDIDAGQCTDIAIIGFDAVHLKERLTRHYFVAHQFAPPSSCSTVAITSSTSSSSTPR
ncbi:hypothetical protein RHECNPAF_3500035 [Rhizobium etli CNPAF512]|nr:hypothetical protein RHECNPAF_3500035 [Rhizobium etli CNPAF512]